MKSLCADLRLWLGLLLLCYVIRLLPGDCEELVAIQRGLQEQRDYSRYEGWCLVAGTAPLIFDRWREVRNTIFTKFRSCNPQHMRYVA